MAVPELCVADVCKAVLFNFVPPKCTKKIDGNCTRAKSGRQDVDAYKTLPLPVTKLRLPAEGGDGLDLLLDHLAHLVIIMMVMMMKE